jgi:predicted Zn finger-like uncharacterized protein
MPLRTTCPQCQRNLTIPDDSAGKKIKCPKCSHVFKSVETPKAAAPSPRKEQAQKKSNGLLYAAVGGAFALLLVIGLGIAGVYWLFNRGGDAARDRLDPASTRPTPPTPNVPTIKGAENAPEETKSDAAALEAEIASAGTGVKLVKLDLGPAGLPLTIEAPEGATAQEGNSKSSVTVTQGDRFCLYIEVGRDDISRRIRFVQSLGMRPIASSPDLLLSVGGGPSNTEFKCTINVSTGYREYAAQSLNSVNNKPIRHTKNNCLLMMKCARTLALNAPLPDDPAAALKQLQVGLRPEADGKITDVYPGQGITDSTLALIRKLPDLRLLVTGYHVHDEELAQLSDCVHLQRLDISGTDIGDTGLKHLRGLVDLEELKLGSWVDGYSKITGVGLAHLSGLGKLKTLSLEHIEIGDADLVSLQRLKSLNSLDLSGVPITGSGLSNLKPLTNLKDLKLSSARVTDGGLTGLSVLVGLEKLRLDDTKISGEGLGCLKDLKNLKYLSLHGAAKITAQGLAEIGKAASLEQLCLTSTSVTDAALPHLMGLRNLKILELQSTPVTEKGASELQRALPQAKIERGS